MAPLNTNQSAQVHPSQFEFRDERFTSTYLGVSVETLRAWRRLGRGPRYRKIGGRCVRYSVTDLESFVEAQPTGGGVLQEAGAA